MISQISEGSSEITYRDRYETVQRVDRLPAGARRVQVPTRIEAPRINVQRALALPPTVTTGSATPLVAPPTVQR